MKYKCEKFLREYDDLKNLDRFIQGKLDRGVNEGWKLHSMSNSVIEKTIIIIMIWEVNDKNAI